MSSKNEDESSKWRNRLQISLTSYPARRTNVIVISPLDATRYKLLFRSPFQQLFHRLVQIIRRQKNRNTSLSNDQYQFKINIDKWYHRHCMDIPQEVFSGMVWMSLGSVKCAVVIAD